MTWTTELPTTAGVYWYRSHVGESLICEVREPTPGDFWAHLTSGYSFRLKGFTGLEWQGPIAPDQHAELQRRIEDLEERIREGEE